MRRVRRLAKLFGLLARNPRVLCSREVLNQAHFYDAILRKDINKCGFPRGLPTIDLLHLFPCFSETIQPYSFLEGTSLPTDLALLKALARQYERCCYLEIGTWRGESISNVASVASKCVSLSLSPKEMREMGLSDDFVDNHNFFSRRLPNVEYIEHNSQAFDFSTLTDKFDLIFVDGDHSYGGIRKDTENVFKVLRDNSSVVVWHDYGYSPETVRWSTLAGILAGCPAEKRKHLYHVSNTMCAVYIERDFATEFVKFPQLPNKQFKLVISAQAI
jgi:predicted O-methyltransferase YrrM